MGSDDSSSDRCKCGHIRFRHQREDAEDAHCAIPSCKCTAFRVRGGASRLQDVPLPEPPMTEEEEEQAPEDGPICGRCYTDHTKGSCESAEAPPQPERRPPYAVAYSVNGHGYEVAVPGDAAVHAIDGALIIRHHLGPVAGIVQVLPIINKEGT